MQDRRFISAPEDLTDLEFIVEEGDRGATLRILIREAGTSSDTEIAILLTNRAYHAVPPDMIADRIMRRLAEATRRDMTGAHPVEAFA